MKGLRMVDSHTPTTVLIWCNSCVVGKMRLFFQDHSSVIKLSNKIYSDPWSLLLIPSPHIKPVKDSLNNLVIDLLEHLTITAKHHNHMTKIILSLDRTTH